MVLMLETTREGTLFQRPARLAPFRSWHRNAAGGRYVHPMDAQPVAAISADPSLGHREGINNDGLS